MNTYKYRGTGTRFKGTYIKINFLCYLVMSLTYITRDYHQYRWAHILMKAILSLCRQNGVET